MEDMTGRKKSIRSGIEYTAMDMLRMVLVRAVK
jgi:hypothetical protein